MEAIFRTGKAIFAKIGYFRYLVIPGLQTTIINLMKMAESFPKRVENTVRKGEIAHYEQFFLFPHVFLIRLGLQTQKNQGLFGKVLTCVERNTSNVDVEHTSSARQVESAFI